MKRPSHPSPLRHLLLPLLLVTFALAACSGGSGSSADGRVVLRLGYFPNVTHAPAIVGIEEGTFQRALGPDVKLELSTFASGTEASEALFSGAIDATFIGPNPAINGFAKSKGEALRIVAVTLTNMAEGGIYDQLEIGRAHV